MKLVLWRPWCRHMRDDIAISSWHWEPFAHEFIFIDAHQSSLGTNSFVYEWMKYSESDATKDSFLSIQLESRPFDFLSILSCTSLSHVGGCSAWYRLSEFWKHHSSQPGRSSLSGCLNVGPEVRDVQQQLYSLHQQTKAWLSLTLCMSMWKDFGIDFGEECFGSRQEKRPQDSELVWIDGGSSSRSHEPARKEVFRGVLYYYYSSSWC